MAGQFGMRFRLPCKSQSSFTCRKSATWDRRLYFPSERRHAVDFFAQKIRRLWPGSDPRSWVPEVSMLTTRPPKLLANLHGYQQEITRSHRKVADLIQQLTKPCKTLGGYAVNLYEPCVLYIGRAHRYPPNTPSYIFFQQIYVLNFLNMLLTLRFFLFFGSCIIRV
jgi:hypothetical protein